MDALFFQKTIESYRDPVLRAGCVIVGYSGGADSSCLLVLMNDWCRKNGVRLAAAHVNHMIRGEEADCDEAFCRRTAESLGAEFFSLRADVPKIAEETGCGTEEAARNVRYAFFDEVSEKLTGSPTGAIIATAHNADDNLETVLFDLMRGSGLRGMCGIDPFRDSRYLRPLICAGSDEIRQWCRENGVEYVTDSTNLGTDYTRNRIRHIIVPEMKKIVPSPEVSVTRMTSLLRRDRDYLEAEADRIAEAGVTRESAASLHPAVASRVLMRLYSRADKTPKSASLEEKHIEEALYLIRSDRAHGSLSLPGCVRLTVDRNSFRFEKDERISSEENPLPFFRYPNDGENFLCGSFAVRFSPGIHENHTENSVINENIYKLSILKILRFDKIKGVLRIRSRQNGDAYRYGGMTHKVKRMLADKKLTALEKSRLPIFEDDCGIVWIPGFPLRDGLAYKGEGQPITIMYFIGGCYDS